MILLMMTNISESGCSSGPSAPSASDQEVGCSDLVFQEPVSEEALIENLYHRFKRDQIYVSFSFCVYETARACCELNSVVSYDIIKDRGLISYLGLSAIQIKAALKILTISQKTFQYLTLKMRTKENPNFSASF